MKTIEREILQLSDKKAKRKLSSSKGSSVSRYSSQKSLGKRSLSG